MQNGTRPNVILVMTDDQGYGDLRCHGNPVVQTPHMDALHAESVRLTNFHVDPTCSPTRAALLTGCYSHRVNVWHTICGRNRLHRNQATIADYFRSAGYATGHFGKWHLGGQFPFRPIDRGFDEWLGQGDGGTGAISDYWGNNRVDDMYLHNGEPIYREGYGPDIFFDAAMAFARDQAQQEQPFFIYLATYIPHNPCSLPDKEWVARLREKVPLNIAYFLASIERADANLGRLMHFLEEEQLADDTILIFLTDNGTASGAPVHNAGMRGKKGSVFEGGHRVPCFLRWRNGELAHGRDVSQLTAHIDLLPTLADACDLSLHDAQLDGQSLLACLKKESFESAFPHLDQRALVVESQRVVTPKKYKDFCVMQGAHRLVGDEGFFDVAVDSMQQRDLSGDDAYRETISAMRSEHYWCDVTAGDDDPEPITLGSKAEPCTKLCAEDMSHREGAKVWNQLHVVLGARSWGGWPIDVPYAGRFRLQARRWPEEVATPITAERPRSQLPSSRAFLHDEEVDDVLFAAFKGPVDPVAIPVAAVCIRVGDVEQLVRVDDEDTYASLTVELDVGVHFLEAFFLDAEGQDLGAVYYLSVEPEMDDRLSRTRTR